MARGTSKGPADRRDDLRAGVVEVHLREKRDHALEEMGVQHVELGEGPEHVRGLKRLQLVPAREGEVGDDTEEGLVADAQGGIGPADDAQAAHIRGGLSHPRVLSDLRGVAPQALLQLREAGLGLDPCDLRIAQLRRELSHAVQGSRDVDQVHPVDGVADDVDKGVDAASVPGLRDRAIDRLVVAGAGRLDGAGGEAVVLAMSTVVISHLSHNAF
mmetsp:Transcript_107128/g.345912  ORF Transcript_107128/g.345912 Transcript_107128/m.345912 type:complete len:215 (-) Transcript_107128:62-706(-)